MFITLEDKTGIANLIVWSSIYDRYRKVARHATLLQVNGVIHRQGQIVHALARSMYDRAQLLFGLSQPSRDFHKDKAIPTVLGLMN